MADRVVNYVFRGNFTSLTAGLAASGKAVADLGTKLTALDKDGAKKRAALSSIGDSAGKIGLVAAAGLGAAVVASAKFDKAMSAVQAATHESTANMELLRAAALKAGADTAFSASEAAGAIEELAKAGISTKDILGGGLSGALNLAAAGSMDVGAAAEIAATALTQFKLGGEDVNHVADLLAAGAGKAQGDVSDLGMALKQSGLVAQQTGLTIEETTGTLAAFAKAGLIGSDSGTSFKTMLQSLTPSGEKAASAMEQYNISAYDAQGNFVGMTKFAASLRDGLKDLSAEQRNAALKTIFGSDAVRAASVVYENGAAGIQSWIDKTDDAGFAAETAATRMDNLAGDVEQLKGSLETALIGAGDGAQGPLRKLVQGATMGVNALGAIPGPAKTATTALLGITAVFGGGLWFTSKVIGGIATMNGALATLGITASTTRAKLALIGTGMTATALGIGSVVDAISQMDSISRSNAAADATVKSFQDLSDALSYSNVGKYADDLHINLNRLAEDLVTNGTEGEYASRVMDQLAGSSHGFGAMLKEQAGTIIPGWTASSTKAYDANKDLGVILGKNKGLLGSGAAAAGDLADATGDAGSAAGEAAPRFEAMSKALIADRKAARATADSFIDFGSSLSDSKVSLGEWIASLRKQANALRNFRVNAQQAAKKGLDEGLIASLEKAGPAGALRMRQLSNATKSEIAKANSAWRAGQREVDRYTDAIGGVPKRVDTDVSVNTGDALAKIRAIVDATKAIPRSLSTSYYVNQINSISKPHAPFPGSADGTTVPKTGRPYADRHPYLLADGEEVISNRNGQADRFRPLLKAINANRLADGGTAMRYAAAAYNSRPTASVAQTRVVERVIVERLADRVTLIDKDGAIGEFVVRRARSEIDADRGYRDGTLHRQGVVPL